MPIDDWVASFEPREPTGERLAADRRPTRIALDDHRPSHQTLHMTGADGIERDVAVTAFPLFAHSEEFVGIVAIFWQE